MLRQSQQVELSIFIAVWDFCPTERPLLELLMLEPEDIHMWLEFPSPGK